MTTDRDIDTILDDWFIEGPGRIADWVVDDALLTIERTPQSRGVSRLPRRLTMFGPLRLATAAAAVVAVVAIGAGLIARNSQPQAGPPVSSPIATASPTPSATPSATPTPSATALPGEGVVVYPGRYVAKFNPRLTLTVDNSVVAIGCAPGGRCHGQVDVDSPGWLDIEFGPPQFDFMVNRVDKVNDPRNAGKLIDPPADLASWISTRPGVSIVSPATSATVGGLPATQIEISTDREVGFGPIPGVTDIGFGLGQGGPVRMLVLRVDGHWVVINTSNRSASLQAIVDSIVWR